MALRDVKKTEATSFDTAQQFNQANLETAKPIAQELSNLTKLLDIKGDISSKEKRYAGAASGISRQLTEVLGVKDEKKVSEAVGEIIRIHMERKQNETEEISRFLAKTFAQEFSSSYKAVSDYSGTVKQKAVEWKVSLSKAEQLSHCLTIKDTESFNSLVAELTKQGTLTTLQARELVFDGAKVAATKYVKPEEVSGVLGCKDWKQLENFMVSRGYESEFRTISNQIAEVMQQISWANQNFDGNTGGSPNQPSQGLDGGLYSNVPRSVASESGGTPAVEASENAGLEAIEPKEKEDNPLKKFGKPRKAA